MGTSVGSRRDICIGLVARFSAIMFFLLCFARYVVTRCHAGLARNDCTLLLGRSALRTASRCGAIPDDSAVIDDRIDQQPQLREN